MGLKEVIAGSQWLDENFPGWEREIDLGELDITDCEVCVLGQALKKHASQGESGYDYGCDLGGTAEVSRGRWSWNHGFLSQFDEPLWRDLIKERFSSGNLSDESPS